MEPQIFQISLKIILRNETGDTLVLQGDENSFTGLWDLPGGRMGTEEAKLSLPEAIHRELLEEVGPIEYTLDEQPQALGKGVTAKGVNIFYVIFEGHYLDGEIIISPEHHGHKWIKLENSDLSELFANGLLEAVTNYLT